MTWIPWKSYNIISKAIGYCNREGSLITLVLAAAVGQNICLVASEYFWRDLCQEKQHCLMNDLLLWVLLRKYWGQMGPLGTPTRSEWGTSWALSVVSRRVLDVIASPLTVRIGCGFLSGKSFKFWTLTNDRNWTWPLNLPQDARIGIREHPNGIHSLCWATVNRKKRKFSQISV